MPLERNELVKILLGAWDFLIFQEAEPEVWDIFNAIAPAAVLFVDIDHGAPEARSDIGIQIDREIERNHAVVAVVAQETLPEYARVFIDHVRLPEADINDSLKWHGVAGKRDEILDAFLLNCLPKCRRDRHNSGKCRRLPDIVGKKGNGLIRSMERIITCQIDICQS